MDNKTILFFVITSILAIYFFVNLYLHISKNSKRNEEISYAQRKMINANKEKELAKKNLLAEIENQFGADASQKVANGYVWNGMPEYLLIVSMGKAEEIKENFFRGTRTEKWFYGGKVNRLGNLKYNLEITVEDQKVIGWRDFY